MEEKEDSLLAQMWAAAQANKVDKVKSLERLKCVSRDRLLGIISKKIQTTMIGALAAVEDSIGRELWGHGKQARDCTPDELFWREIWQEKVRPAILNNGNNQLRALQAELLLYEMVWTGYQHVLPVRQERGTDNG